MKIIFHKNFMVLFFLNFMFFLEKNENSKKMKISEKIQFFSKKCDFFRKNMVVGDKYFLFYHAKA